MDDKPQNNPNLEPIAGQPGWYWDPKTGRTVSEEELGSHLEEFPDIKEDEEPYQMFSDEDGEQEDDYSDEEQDLDVENPEPSQNDNPRDEQPKTNSEPTSVDEGSSGDEPLDKFKKPTDALDALPTDKMGETGEKIEDVKKAVKLAKDIGEAIETEGASLANIAKDIEMAKEAKELADKYAKEAIKRQIIITLFAFLIVFGVPIAIVSMAFMGYGTDSASGLTPGGAATVKDGDRDALAEQVLAHPNITFQSNEARDIDPKQCYTAPLPDSRMQPCVQKPVLQFLLALADAGQKVEISTLIRDHDYATASGNVSKHASGLAVDIGNDEAFLGMMKWITSNLLNSSIAPHQVLCAGADNVYGAGVVVPEIDNLSVDGGKIFPGFTSRYVGDHTNHIHVGY